MNRRYFKLLCLALAMAPFQALAQHGPHVHGTAELHIVIEGGSLAVELRSPLENLIGFEHAPATGAQRAAVKAMQAKLAGPAALFRLPAAASCKAGAVRIASPVTDAPATKPKPAAKPVRDDDHDHADLSAEFAFECARIDKLDSIQVNLFDAFPGTRTIHAQVAGPRGQSSRTLSPDQRSIRF